MSAVITSRYSRIIFGRAVDPHPFFADLDPAVFSRGSGSSFKNVEKNNLIKSFLNWSTVKKKQLSECKFTLLTNLNKIGIFTNFPAFFQL